MIQFLAKSKVAKTAVMGLVCGTVLFTVAAGIYISHHYADMPRFPQPETGRIYAINTKYGGVVYINKQELARRDFVEYYLMPASGVSMLVLFFLGTRLGWFEKRNRFGGNPHQWKRF